MKLILNFEQKPQECLLLMSRNMVATSLIETEIKSYFSWKILLYLDMVGPNPNLIDLAEDHILVNISTSVK